MNVSQLWYRPHLISLLLAPLSFLFCASVYLRKWAYQQGRLHSHRSPVPVIIIGNITVGGTGKTPLVIWLAEYLTQHGFKVGIISRGYGGRGIYPLWVTETHPATLVGDEALLLARTGCPVVIAPRRFIALQYLLARAPCDVILSDDGLQHYALQRDIEIAVIDGERGLGNGYCLPAGPLRESASRLQQVDFIISKNAAWQNATVMRYEFSQLHALTAATTQTLENWRGQTVHAIAAIGHPEAFFAMLERQGLILIRHIFPDHHQYRRDEIIFSDTLPVIMTEKDAVKCRSFADQRHWYAALTINLPQHFGEQVVQRLRRDHHG
jgi:tetraacyldisaccharide 4'-kinase